MILVVIPIPTATVMNTSMWIKIPTLYIYLFWHIINLFKIYSEDNKSLDDDDKYIIDHVYYQFIDDNDENFRLPVPLYSCIKPTMGLNLTLYILLLIGRFEKYIYLNLQSLLCELFWYSKLIGPSGDTEDLQNQQN